MMRPRTRQILRIARVAGGAGLFIVGVVLLVLPGPGTAMLVGALVLLGAEFRWARELRARLSQAAGRAARCIPRAATWFLTRAAYGLAILPVLTDWVDTGHWPQHPREYVTEIIVGMVIFFGVWRLLRRAERFRALAHTDPLTGLGNRARFRVDLDAAVDRARADRSNLAVAIVDVDQFKDINDTFGHAEGDDVLREVGVALARSVRQGVDGCYRPGGDEFAVLMFGVGAQQALHALRRGFARASKVIRRPISCSIGIVTLRDGETTDELVHRADHFMYLAKGGSTLEGDDLHAFGRAALSPEDGSGTKPRSSKTASIHCSSLRTNG